MKAFVLSLNGQRLCTIGIGDDGVLSVHVTWVGNSNIRDNLHMYDGGLDSSTDEHVRWPVPSIRVGDRVLIEVIEATEVDLPVERGRRDREAELTREQDNEPQDA